MTPAFSLTSYVYASIALYSSSSGSFSNFLFLSFSSYIRLFSSSSYFYFSSASLFFLVYMSSSDSVKFAPSRLLENSKISSSDILLISSWTPVVRSACSRRGWSTVVNSSSYALGNTCYLSSAVLVRILWSTCTPLTVSPKITA